MTREELLKYEYETKLAELREEQATCKHEWEEPEYDPEIQTIPRYKNSFSFGDYAPEIDGFTEKKIDRWSRTCKKCGKVEYTKEQVVVKTVPKF